MEYSIKIAGDAIYLAQPNNQTIYRFKRDAVSYISKYDSYREIVFVNENGQSYSINFSDNAKFELSHRIITKWYLEEGDANV